MRRFFAVAVI